LRYAITAADAHTGASQITFNIPTSDANYASSHHSFTISPTSGLPSITSPVTIDGTTEWTYLLSNYGISVSTPVIVLDGVNAGALINGLFIQSGNSTVKGLVINNFASSGIELATPGATGDVIEGNYIGTDVTGTIAEGNQYGVDIFGGASGNTIGGAAAAARNIISGNSIAGLYITGSNGNLVQGNYIGTDVTGAVGLSDVIGVEITGGSSNNTIGSATAGNVISGNSSIGLEITGSGVSSNFVVGNYIGTNANGTAALGNDVGIKITNSASSNTVGGTALGTGNLISGNTSIGVWMAGSGVSNNTVAGNLIGTTPAGTAALGNTFGVTIDSGASDNTIGGTTPAARNIISGNKQGIEIGDSTPDSTSGNVVEGNYVSTDITGSVGLGNGNESIEIDNAPDTTIGGLTTTPGTGAGNVISGAAVLTNYFDYGITVTGASNGTVIEGNILGLNAAGTGALPDFEGIYLDSSTGVTVGGTIAGSRNIISANTNMGIEISNGASGNVIEGNSIGTNAAGTSAEPNRMGVKIDLGASDNTVGGDAANAGNIIDFNSEYGVDIDNSVGYNATGNAILGNSIYANTTSGIALTNGATAGSSASPVVNAVYTSGTSTSVVGSLTSTANSTFDLNFFANSSGSQGEYYLGSAFVETDSTGVAYFDGSWPVASTPSQTFTVTVTAYGTSGTQQTNTSMFSGVSVTPTPHTPPTVSVGGPSAGIVGLPVVYTSTVTDVNAAQPDLVYSWSVTGPNGSGFTLPGSAVTNQPTFNFTPDQTGAYAVTLTINDGVSIVSSTSTLQAGLVGPGAVISGLTQDVIATGASVSLNGALEATTGSTAVSYAWTVTSNGQTVDQTTGASLSFNPQTNGLYSVSLTIIDSNGTVSIGNVFFTVASEAPQAVILGAPQQGLEGVAIPLVASGANEGLSGPLTYAWDVYLNSTLVGSQSGSSSQFTFTPGSAGEYEVELEVSDTHGDHSNADAYIAVGDVPPSAAISAPSSAAAGSPVTLNGSGASASSGDTVTSYNWSIYSTGNGSVTRGSGQQFTFTPSVAGVDVVTLAVVGESGATGWATTDITVTQANPSLLLNPPLVTTADQPGTISAIVNNAPTGVTYSFVWNIIGQKGPFTPTGNSPASNLAFTPVRAGSYVAIVTATGSNGTVLTAQESFTVNPVVPTVTITTLTAPTTYQQPSVAGSVFAGTFVSFSADASELDAATGAVHYSWTISGPAGFALSGTSPAIDFTPAQPGTYSVSLLLTDDYGFSAHATSSLTVATSQPSVAILNAAGTSYGSSTFTQNLTASVSDPGSNGSYNYKWYLNGILSGQTGPNFSFAGNISDLGNDSVTVTVTDNLANSATTTTAFQVAEPGTTLVLPATGFAAGTQVMALALGNAKVDATQLPPSVSVVEVALGGNDTLLGGAGLSVLQGDSGSNSLVGGAGADTLIATSNDTLIASSGQSNVFQINPGPGEVVTATASSKNNTLSFASATAGVTVSLNQGLQVIDTSGDSIDLTGSIQQLVGGAGNDNLSLGSASKVALFAGTGNDMASSTGGSSITILGGSGNDTISLSGDANGFVVGGAGNSTTMVTGGSSITMFSGTGNDMASSSGGSSITIFGGSGNDTISLSGDTGAQIIAGAGTTAGGTTMTVTGGSSITMFSGTGNDMASSTGGSSITILGGSGNDTISLIGDTGSLTQAGAGNATITQSGGSSITMFSGTGNDMASSTGGSSITILGGSGNDTINLSGGTGSLVQSGAGNTTVTQSGGSSITMFSGTGNDMSTSSGGSSITVLGGSGNDTINLNGDTGAMAQGGAGNTTITQSGGSSITMFSGTGNDMSSSTGGSSITILGGSGNDTINLSGATGAVVQDGSGNTTVTQGGGSSITMFSGTGNDMSSSIGGSSITILGGSGNDIISVNGDSNALILGGTGNTTTTVTGGSSITMFSGTGNDMASSTGGSSITILGGSGNDTISMTGDTSALEVSGTGTTSTTSTGGSSITMFSGTGNDMASSTGGSSITILGGSGNDTINLTGDTGALVIGGAGNTTATVSGGSSITMFSGTGNDMSSSIGGSSITILGGSGNDTLNLTGDTSSMAQGGAGNTTITQSGGSSITMFSGTGNDMASSSGGSSITILGGSGNDIISVNGGTGTLVQGGDGNSTMTLSGGSSITMFSGTGNDMSSSSGGSSITILGGSGNDTINLTGDTGAMVQAGAGNTTITQSGGSSITMFSGTGNDMTSSSGGSSITIAGGTGNDTINANQDSSSLMIGGSGNSTMTLTGGSSITMFSGTGNDMSSSTGGSSITILGGSGNDTLSASGDTNSAMQGGAGNATITQTGGSSITMYGGAGNDRVSSTHGHSVTIFGGAGNDALQSSGDTGLIMIGGSGNST
jgi:Ca2+-binding RTX toxin-like protein